MPFNEEQLAAINASSKKDILITAGAGSGKTKTLSERVFSLIERKEIKPEALLVLTFTNNASYEMKTRILDRFGPGHPLYGKMQSCHVQSFDSFRAYLVRSNAQALNVPKTFVVMPESIEEEKKVRFVNEVVADCFTNPEKKPKLIRFLTKFGFHDEDKLVQSVAYLTDKLLKISPSRRERFFSSYASSFFAEDALRTLYDQEVEKAKKSLSLILHEAFFLDRHYEDIFSSWENGDLDSAILPFTSSRDFDADLSSVRVGESTMDSWYFLPSLFSDLYALLELPSEEFVSAALTFVDEHSEAYGNSGKKAKDATSSEQERLKAVHKCLKGSAAILAKIGDLGPFTEAYEKATFAKEEELFLLELAKEAISRLDAYKRSVNAFSFGDIGYMAMSLFEEERFKDAADKIVSRFDYIMVDEYQDDDDEQENLLTALTRLRPDGSRAHLFCVGDAKQSIYAFRGANLNHFKERAKNYKDSSLGEVIPMNKNYRSAKRVLDDINYIFSSYMRPDNGGIDYLDEAERLTYDEKANLYCVETGNYGVRRIVPPNDFHLQNKSVSQEGENLASYEAMAILDDIKRKVAEKHLIYNPKAKDGEPKLRPVDYGDFAILVRKKTNTDIYQKLFLANNIPLNNHISDDLREISPIILIRSLLGLMGNRLYGERKNEAHLFASIARSYAFRYDDTTLHEILTGAGCPVVCDTAEAIRYCLDSDPIMKAVTTFVEEHRLASFEAIFLDLVETFHVVSALPYLGEVEAHISKIESLFAMAMAERDLGVGLSGFIAFFDSVEEYDIKLKSETITETKGAVDLMTIHASKGLERKIVYMPSSDSGLGRGDARNNPPFSFSLERGICFPYLGYEIPEDIDPSTPIGGPISTLRTLAFGGEEKETEAHEHVRILYVALTRAENAFYLVGKNHKSCGYIMMDDLPKRIRIHPALIEEARKEGTLDENALKNFLRLEEELFKTRLPLAATSLGENYDLAKRLWDSLVLDPLKELRDEALLVTLNSIHLCYKKRFLAKASDIDFLSSVYASVFYPALARQENISSYSRLLASLAHKDKYLDKGDEEEEEIETEKADDSTGMEKRLLSFKDGIEKDNVLSYCPFVAWTKDALEGKTKKGEDFPHGVRKVFIDTLLPALARIIDDIPYVAYESYRNEGFQDDTLVYDGADFKGNRSTSAPVFPTLTINDDPIVFEEVEKRRASKKSVDPDFVDPIVLERGTHLHRLFQLSKLDENNLDFIANPKEKEIIRACLGHPLLQEAKQGTAYPEYGYYDTDFDTTGYIDLLYFDTNGACHIVDYKTYDIDDSAYDEQLHVYRRNVARIFKLNEKDIRLHLLSITKGKSRDVE